MAIVIAFVIGVVCGYAFRGLIRRKLEAAKEAVGSKQEGKSEF